MHWSLVSFLWCPIRDPLEPLVSTGPRPPLPCCPPLCMLIYNHWKWIPPFFNTRVGEFLTQRSIAEVLLLYPGVVCLPANSRTSCVKTEWVFFFLSVSCSLTLSATLAVQDSASALLLLLFSHTLDRNSTKALLKILYFIYIRWLITFIRL